MSVSLVIGVGSSQDYKHRSGLAHFCEVYSNISFLRSQCVLIIIIITYNTVHSQHMVHHGCEKFKEEDSYFKYVMVGLTFFSSKLY